MRSLWKGALHFGLIHIPVRMYSASVARELKFKLLHKKDHSEIRYARICKEDGREIPWQDVVKGYEYKKGKYVVLTEEDFRNVDLEKTRSLEILDFTDEGQIDAIYYDTPYYLEPEKGAESTYALLWGALKLARKIAVGRFVFHSHEHIGVIRPHRNLLVLHQLRYQSQLRDPKELQIPRVSVKKAELDMALQLVKELSRPFHPERYSDAYTREVEKMIQKKARGEKILGKRPKEAPPKVHDILSLLKGSLQQQRKGRRKIA